VKRQHSLPLLQTQLPDVYLIDSSAWLNIVERTDADDVWSLIVSLIKQGRVVACAQVLGELRESDIYLSRLKPYEKALLAGDHPGDDVAYLQHVGRITHEYPAMSKATGRRTPADPYIVALAELENYVVVTDESKTKRPNRKIPGVCQQRGIRCITLDQFVTAVKKETRA
jgi:hypothetical protein